MTDKITPEDRHIEAAIQAADAVWEPSAIRASQVGVASRSIMAHAETLAMVERALNAPMIDHSQERKGVYDILRSILSNLKDK